MKHALPVLALSLLTASAPLLAAGGHSHDHDDKKPAATTAQANASTPMAEGEVRKIYKEERKIAIKHGEIKNLDMGPMTMVFQVRDAALFDKVKEGDKVGFTAEKIGGQYTVTGIEKK